MNFVFGSVENIVRKGENSGYQHFLLFPQGLFQKAFFSVLFKFRIVWAKVNPYSDVELFSQY